MGGCAPRATATGSSASAATPEPVEISTAPMAPPFRPSNEASAEQLARTLAEGKAVQSQMEWVEREEGVASGETAAGEYLVTYVITPADDYYDLEAAQSSSPAHHTTVQPGSAHVAIVVRDAADGRAVQGLDVRVTLHSENGGSNSAAALPFGWHPVLNRYGENMILPDGPFTLVARIGMPSYRRSDAVNGKRFSSEVTARFADVSVSADSLAAASRRLARGDSRESVQLAAREGATIDAQLAAVLRGNANGAETVSGDYRISVVVRPERGYWEVRAGALRFVGSQQSVGPVVHVAVAIRDRATGRFIPGLRVRATLLDARRREIDTYAMPFMWHPWSNEYGLTIADPGPGRFTMRIRAEAPSFRRYGSSALRKFNRPIDAEVRGLSFELPVADR